MIYLGAGEGIHLNFAEQWHTMFSRSYRFNRPYLGAIFFISSIVISW